MCLFKIHSEPKISQSDIEVWKILTDEGLSPFQNYPYHHGMNKPAEQKTIPVPVEQRYVIEGGYLHAYINKKRAEAHALLMSGGLVTGCYFNLENAIPHVVQRMIIPKGTAYYEGYEEDICAECLYWPEKE